MQLRHLIDQHGEAFWSNAIVVVTKRQVRIRRWGIGASRRGSLAGLRVWELGVGRTRGWPTSRRQKAVEVGEEIAASVIASGCDQGERASRAIEFVGGGDAEQGSQVDEILGPRGVVAGQHLECDQVSRGGDGHREARQQLDDLGLRGDLRLNAGRGEQEVDDRRLGFWGAGEAHGRESADGLLLDDRVDAVVELAELANQGFGFRVARRGDGEVGVPGEARFGSCGHGQAADERERHVGAREVAVNPPQARRERGRGGVQPRRRVGRGRRRTRLPVGGGATGEVVPGFPLRWHWAGFCAGSGISASGRRRTGRGRPETCPPGFLWSGHCPYGYCTAGAGDLATGRDGQRLRAESTTGRRGRPGRSERRRAERRGAESRGLEVGRRGLRQSEAVAVPKGVTAGGKGGSDDDHRRRGGVGGGPAATG